VTEAPGGRARRPLAATLVILACLLIAAHCLRADWRILALLCVASPGLLLVGRPWASRLLQLILLVATGEWLRTMAVLVHDRLALELPWHRMAIILVAVAVVTLWSARAVPRASRVAAAPDRS
jgi:hypothetical protein